MLPTFLKNVTVQEAFETTAQINKELKITEFDGAFSKKVKLRIDGFSSFFAKRRKSLEKMIHQKKNRGHRLLRWQQWPSAVLLTGHFSCYLVRASMHDVARESAWAVKHRNNKPEQPKMWTDKCQKQISRNRFQNDRLDNFPYLTQRNKLNAASEPMVL